MNDTLYHHGIKGQKWGVRRFQNKDGSLTSEGRSRYSSDESKNKSERNKRIAIGVGVGAVLVASSLAVYGGMKHRDFVKKVAHKMGEAEFNSNKNSPLSGLTKEQLRDSDFVNRVMDEAENRERSYFDSLFKMKYKDLRKMANPYLDYQKKVIRNDKRVNAETQRRFIKDLSKTYRSYAKIGVKDFGELFRSINPIANTANFVGAVSDTHEMKKREISSLKEMYKKRKRRVHKMSDVLNDPSFYDKWRNQ